MTRLDLDHQAAALPAVRPWSCDTFAVHAEHTRYGATLFGKNSDRPARETQPLHWLEGRRGGGRLRLAYVEIDDIAETIPHLGSSPYWCWGHEIGVNAEGVAIGNEALFTRDVAATAAADRAGREVSPGILGMELVRLGLERGRTAAEAVSVMTDLIERYGQYGAGTVSKDRPAAAYDNSYLIADATEVWVLETTGRRWVTKQVRDPYWALSNEPTLRNDWDSSSADLREYASAKGWGDSPGRLDFASTFLDPAVPLQVSHLRLQRSRQLLSDAATDGGVGFAEARGVLSDHYEGTFLGGPKFNPARPDFHTLCMHEHPSGFTWGNTAASMIAVLPTTARPYLWWAATTPCTSIYIPVAMTGAALPTALSKAGTQNGTGPHPEHVEADASTAGSYWWSLQNLLEAVAGDTDGNRYHERQPQVRARFDELQQQWLKQVDDLVISGTDSQWQQLTGNCVAEAQAAADELVREFRDH
jgi:secernin